MAVKWELQIDYLGGEISGAREFLRTDLLTARILEVDYRREGPTNLIGLAPPARAVIRLADWDGRLKRALDAGTGLTLGADVLLTGYAEYDDWPENGDVGGSRSKVGGSEVFWEEMAPLNGGFSAQDGALRGKIARRPGDTLGGWPLEHRYFSAVVLYRRTTNGQGGLAMWSGPGQAVRIRFLRDAVVVERVEGRSVTRLGSGPLLDAGQWHRVELHVRRDGLRVYELNLEDPEAGPFMRRVVDLDGDWHLRGDGTDYYEDWAGLRFGAWASFRNTADRWGRMGIGATLLRGYIEGVRAEGEVLTVMAVDYSERWRHRVLYGASDLEGGIAPGDILSELEAAAGLPLLVRINHYVGTGRFNRSVYRYFEESFGEAANTLAQERSGLVFQSVSGEMQFLPASTMLALLDTGGLNSWSDGELLLDKGRGGYELGRAVGEVGIAWHQFSEETNVDVWHLTAPVELASGTEEVFVADFRGVSGYAYVDVTKVSVKAGSRRVTGIGVTGGDDSNVVVEVRPAGHRDVYGEGVVLRIRNAAEVTRKLEALVLTAPAAKRTGLRGIAQGSGRDGGREVLITRDFIGTAFEARTEVANLVRLHGHDRLLGETEIRAGNQVSRAFGLGLELGDWVGGRGFTGQGFPAWSQVEDIETDGRTWQIGLRGQ